MDTVNIHFGTLQAKNRFVHFDTEGTSTEMLTFSYVQDFGI